MRGLFRLWLVLLFAVAPAAAMAQSHAPFKIMMLLYRGETDAERGFIDYFRKQKIDARFIIRDAQADKSKIAGFVREAKAIRPDLIYTFGTTVTTEVVGLQSKVDPERHITDIPVVFNIVADPVGAGLVNSLQSSRRNLTGASHLVPLAAQLKALQAMRSTRTMAVIYTPQEKNSSLTVKELQELAPRFSMNLKLAPVPPDVHNQNSVEGVRRAVEAVVAARPQFIYLPSDSFLIQHAGVVVQAANQAGIPVFSATEAPIRVDGALLGLVSTYYNVGELAAYKAADILQKKRRAADIPVEVLHRFTYLVNMGTAKKLEIYPPLSVVKIAEMVAPVDVDARE